MVHLVINCVQKTKTIQVFFEKCSLRRLSLQSPSTNYDWNHHALRQIIEATHQNIKNLCCGVSRTKQTLVRSISLPD